MSSIREKANGRVTAYATYKAYMHVKEYRIQVPLFIELIKFLINEFSHMLRMHSTVGHNQFPSHDYTRQRSLHGCTYVGTTVRMLTHT